MGASNRTEIVKHFKALLDFGKYEIYTGIVSSVDENKATCDVLLDEEITVYDVRLRAVIDNTEGMYIIPAVDSPVIIGQIDGGQDYALIQASKIDKLLLKIGNITLEVTSAGVVFNGGQLDGMVKLNDLVTQLNKLENKVNSILTGLKAISIPLAPTGTYPFGSNFAAMPSLQTTVKANLENLKIKQ